MSIIQRILSLFGGAVPGGEALAQANEIREKVLEIKKKIQEGGLKSTAVGEGKTLAGDQMEGVMTEQAEGLWDEHVGTMISSKGIPASVANPIKEKAIEEFVKLLRAQYDKMADKVG
jgi:hypothetical protein